MDRQNVSTENAPRAIGPYSQAVRANGFLFVSGQIPIDPASGEIPPDIRAQTRQVLDNLQAVLIAGGSALDKVVKVTVFIEDMNDFEKVNEVYNEYLGPYRPARACVEVRRLPRNCKIEIEAIGVC